MNEWSRLALVTAATADVVTLAEAKKQSRIFHDDEDTQIPLYIDAAVAFIEGPNGIGVALRPQTWRLSLDHFPCEITVPFGPVTEIVSISYADTAGAPATLTSWRVDLDTQPVRIWPARDTNWPAIRCEPGAVKVTFECGYSTPPADLKAAVLLLAAHFYEHRVAVSETQIYDLPVAVQSILERYRVGRFA
ncbi:head-tail connector protein [Phyllobacterium sp. A18/5-2]|uniref:head-tail connector protein n=1 Tax=Phyllobacterium sp. A18/5-2 TaxID=2978392 RepID=UPI0021C9505E|nr:head-tail connector protein [Phyllobacterium sp. A18/5-2]UXN62903.1 head-tail connector protein [Phyllobacterium sp. A18/5-2]